ncbi:hypothetical protein PoB_006330400 [Plakobranchus ocellatus]|uniref:Uncharacterized protein n=1 Tax=Plakobranchus ocellatus TaxID=259542 RepID=A0AAV4CY31_9GAST|nr:hypothetical protein PoB_006330400 [Plakobranchus ocellatus]
MLFRKVVCTYISKSIFLLQSEHSTSYGGLAHLTTREPGDTQKPNITWTREIGAEMKELGNTRNELEETAEERQIWTFFMEKRTEGLMMTMILMLVLLLMMMMMMLVMMIMMMAMMDNDTQL